MATDHEYGSSLRERIFQSLIVFLSLIFIGRLAYLQFIQGNVYRSKAETQAIKEYVIEPFRGNMFDRKGRLMVQNSPSFTILLTPNDFPVQSLPLLSSILQMDTTELKVKLDEFIRHSRFSAGKLLRDADFRTVAAIEENHDQLPGVEVIVESKRVYSFDGNGSHVFGYAREISENRLKTAGDYYRPGDIIGTTGIEAAYETFLRGQKGSQFFAVNVVGQKVSSFNNGKNDILAQEGFDLHLGIDRDLQVLGEKLLNGRRGGIVALDPSTGEILCMVSKPDYDLRAFAGTTDKNIYGRLLLDTAKPLFNRATLTTYPPGSTWKMLMGIAAIEEGLITEKWKYNCPGYYAYGGRSWKCHGSHGPTDVRKAVHVSCNAFFNHLGLRLGLEKFTKWGRLFGFGQRTGVDLGEEGRGLLPSAEYYKNRFFSNGTLVNLGIGQGELGVTPLQMAVYCAALANRGSIVVPHAVKAMYNKYTKKLEQLEYQTRKVEVSAKTWDVIQAGMYDVVNVPGGTAKAAKLEDVAVCGKTGTAQNPHGKDHAWFICYAPAENPKIAMCVMVENAGFGGAVSAPIAQKLLDGFFHPEKFPQLDSAANTMIKDPVPQTH